jgi:hypothetical protein
MAPEAVAPKGSPENARAIELLEKRLGAKGDAMFIAKVRQLLAALYEAEGLSEKARMLVGAVSDSPQAKGDHLANSVAARTCPEAIDGNTIIGTYSLWVKVKDNIFDDTETDVPGRPHGFLYDGQTWKTIDVPGAQLTNPVAISGNKIVGMYRDGANKLQAFIYDGTTWKTLAMPGATDTDPVSISGSKIVGKYGAPSQERHGWFGFLYDGEAWKTVDAPGAIWTEPTGISGNNIVGKYMDASNESRAFVYDGKTMQTLEIPQAKDISPVAISGNSIVGTYSSNNSRHGFLYDGKTFHTIDVPGAQTTNPVAISGNRIVGTYWSNKSRHGFLYDGKTLKTLDMPGGKSTEPTGISGNVIVGWYTIESNKEADLILQKMLPGVPLGREEIHGFLYDGKTWKTLDMPATPEGVASAVTPTPPKSAGQSSAQGIAPSVDRLPQMQFFGSVGKANHLVYVIDRSGSMAPTFQQVRHELLKSISKLQPAQDFTIILFDGDSCIEGPQKRLVSATPENKIAAKEFLDTITASGSTNVLPALRRAFLDLKYADPNTPGRVIYLLSDGDFAGLSGGSRYISAADGRPLKGNEAVIQWLRDNNPKDEKKGLVHVNTFLYLNKDEDAMKVMETIAKENGGRFKLISSDE